MSTVAAPHTTRLNGIAPQFLVADLDRAIAYYRDKLGFQVDFVYESFYSAVIRDGFAIHLKCAPQPAGYRDFRKQNEHLDAYISVLNIRELFGELSSHGARVIKPVQDQPWGCVDFYVEDPDGNVLCFSERKG